MEEIVAIQYTAEFDGSVLVLKSDICTVVQMQNPLNGQPFKSKEEAITAMTECGYVIGEANGSNQESI